MTRFRIIAKERAGLIAVRTAPSLSWTQIDLGQGRVGSWLSVPLWFRPLPRSQLLSYHRKGVLVGLGVFVMTPRLALEYLQMPFISPKEKGRQKPRRLFPADIKDWLRVWGRLA